MNGVTILNNIFVIAIVIAIVFEELHALKRLKITDERKEQIPNEEIKGITESNLREDMKGKVYTKEEELLILDGIRKCVLRYAAGISQENCDWHKEYQNYLSKKQKELEQ